VRFQRMLAEILFQTNFAFEIRLNAALVNQMLSEMLFSVVSFVHFTASFRANTWIWSCYPIECISPLARRRWKNKTKSILQQSVIIKNSSTIFASPLEHNNVLSSVKMWSQIPQNVKYYTFGGGVFNFFYYFRFEGSIVVIQ